MIRLYCYMYVVVFCNTHSNSGRELVCVRVRRRRRREPTRKHTNQYMAIGITVSVPTEYARSYMKNLETICTDICISIKARDGCVYLHVKTRRLVLLLDLVLDGVCP